MSELLFVFGTDKQFRPFQHRLHHDSTSFGNLHHTVEFQCQMLFTLDIEHNTAHIRLMHRPHHLCHHREPRATRKGKHFFLVVRNKLLHNRNTCRAEQCLHIVRGDITVRRNGIYNPADTGNIHSKELDFIIGRPRGIHYPRKCRAESHLIGKVHMALCQESGNLGSRRIDGRKNRKNRLLAMQHLLVQHIIHFKHGHQPRSAENSHYSINIVKLLLTILQTEAQMFRRTRSQNINGIPHSRTGEKLTLKFLRHRSFQFRNIQSTLTQCIGQHHSRTAGMGNDGEVFPFQFRQCEDTTYGRQLLARIATHNTRLTEQGLYRRIATGNGPRMRTRRPAAAFATARLDGRNLAALLDERGCMKQQTVGVTDTLYIKKFYSGIRFRIEVFVHVLQHILHADLLGIAHRPYRVELQSLGHGALQYEHRCGTGAGNQVHPLRMQLRDGLAEYTVMPRVHKTDTVGAYQRGSIPVHRFQYAIFQHSTLMGLLTKTGRKDNERLHLLLRSKHLHRIGTKRGRYGKDGKVRIGNVLHIRKGSNTLHFSLFRIHGTKLTGISAAKQIFQDSPSGFVYIIGCPHYHNTGRVK